MSDYFELQQLILSPNFVWLALHDVTVGYVSLKQQLLAELNEPDAATTHNWRSRAVRRHLSSSKELVLFVSGLPPNLDKYKYIDIINISTKGTTIDPVFNSLGCVFIAFTNGYSASISYQILQEQQQDGKVQCAAFIPYIALPANSAPDYNPLLVFVNLKSGGGQGKRVLEILKTILNPHQIFLVGENGPMPGLYAFRKLKQFRILVCGGDGTVGWVLSTLELVYRYMTCKKPPIAVMPLGTGNDLARVLGYGPGWNGESIPNILAQVQEAKPIKLDRWTIFFDTSPNETPVHKSSEKNTPTGKEEKTAINVVEATSSSSPLVISSSENSAADFKDSDDKSRAYLADTLGIDDASKDNPDNTVEEKPIAGNKLLNRQHHIFSSSDLEEEKLKALSSELNQEEEETCELVEEEDISRNEEAISGLILKTESEHLTFIPNTLAMKNQNKLLSMLMDENPSENSESNCSIHSTEGAASAQSDDRLWLKTQSTLNNNMIAKTAQVQAHTPLSRTDMVTKNRTLSEVDDSCLSSHVSIGQHGKKLSLPILCTPSQKSWKNGSIDEVLLKSLEEEGDTNDSTSKTANSGPKTVTMNSYMGMGIDADVSLAFHLAREENPEKCSSRFQNKAIYFKAGVKKMTSRSKQLSSVIDLEVDGNKINLPSIKGLLFLNITSWGSGANAWGNNSSRRFQTQDIGDNLIEIIGFSGVAHMSQVYSGLRSGIRIAQGEYIRIKLWSEIAVQVDGEPWVQPAGDIVITVSPMEVFMLKRQKKKK